MQSEGTSTVCSKKENAASGRRNHKKRLTQKFIETEEFFSDNDNEVIKNPFSVDVFINGNTYTFQLDTGASISAISEKFWMQNFSQHKLVHLNKCLNVYTGEKMLTLGFCKLKIFFNNISKLIDIYVIKNGDAPILGRDFMSSYHLNISQINFCSDLQIENCIKKYNKLFSPGIGTFNRGT